MTSLNGLPARTWDSFIQGICARNKLVKFSRLWEECSQEEARIAAWEEKIGSEDQALAVQSKKPIMDNHHLHSKGKHSSYKKSQLICYTYDEIGHFAKYCPRNKNVSHKKKGNKRRHHAHAAEDDEPSIKRIRQESDDSSSDEEYVLISALTGNITHGCNDWLIDSGASKHMTGFKESFWDYQNMNHPTRWNLGMTTSIQ